MKPSKPIYVFIIIGLIIAMMAGIGIVILAFTGYLNADSILYRLMFSAIGIYVFAMFFGGFIMALRYKKETFLTDNERKKQWKILNPQFRNIWAFLMNLTSIFFGMAAIVMAISVILYKDWTYGIGVIFYAGLIVKDIIYRKKHPEQYKIIRIFNTEKDFINELENPPLWREVYRFIIWTPIGLIYHLWAFFSKTKKPKKFTREILFHIVHKKSKHRKRNNHI